MVYSPGLEIKEVVSMLSSQQLSQGRQASPKTLLQSSVWCPKYYSRVYNTKRRNVWLPYPRLFPSSQTDVDSPSESRRPCFQRKKTGFQRRNTGFKCFPFDNFTYYLTLFSKFFSSFPHGTCSLSVSRQYLALDGIYHPLWSAFPNKPTLWKCIA